VQHVPNPLRRESRNVGVIVERNGDYDAKFVGETDGKEGQLDKRSTRFFEHPEIYEQWVKYWRRSISKGGDVVSRLTKANGGHFNVVEAGFVAGTEDDPITAVCQYTYGLLVSEDGLAEALGYPDDGLRGNDNLKTELHSEFKRLGILGNSQSLTIANPVRHNVQLAGVGETYAFSFVQAAQDRLRVYEPINLATRQKVIARDHAFWMAAAFDDTKLRHENLEAIAIARYRPSDLSDDAVRSALRKLEKSANVLDWNSSMTRRKFLGECESLALAG
jgi:hypothetical protein